MCDIKVLKQNFVLHQEIRKYISFLKVKDFVNHHARTESFEIIDVFQNKRQDYKRHEEKVHKSVSGISLVKFHLFFTAKSKGHF